jgi:hypothetical protein
MCGISNFTKITIYYGPQYSREATPIITFIMDEKTFEWMDFSQMDEYIY